MLNEKRVQLNLKEIDAKHKKLIFENGEFEGQKLL